MGDFCGANVEAPDVPIPGNPTATWGDTISGLVNSEAALAGYNLEDVARKRSEEEATRAAFETSTGMPYTDYLAKTAVQESQINKAAMDRYQKALAGELPVSPALEKSLAEKGVNLQEKYLKQLGPGYDVSTPYVRAQREFDTMAEALRQQSREGAISSAEQLGYANPVAPITSINKLSSLESPNQFKSLFDLYKFNQASQNQAALSGYNAKVGANMATSENTGNLWTGAGNLLGNLGSLYFGGKSMGLF